MKKNVFSVVTAMSLGIFVSHAQIKLPCGSDEVKDYFIKNKPGYQEQLEQNKQLINAEFQSYLSQKAAQKMAGITTTLTTYTIPVVFHILHTNGTENVPDSTCIAALEQVNRDYARKNSDTTNIDPLYEPLYVNSHMHFELAKKDPQGNCTNGIIHHYDENTNWKQSDLYNYQYTTVGANNWSPTKYLNVYIVKTIIGEIQAGVSIGGYTYKPGTAPNIGSDAVVLSLNLLYDLSSRGLSHEIGHWFGLSHVFDGNGGFRTPASTNNTPPYFIGFRCGNDDIADTPKTPGFLSICPYYQTLNDSCDIGKRPNIHNIMDYASCPLMFTQGQTDKIRFSAESSIASRNNLWSTSNLQAVGILNNTVTACAPIADFGSNKIDNCVGQTVNFNSTSYNGNISSYSWSFEGGTPATSTSPTVAVTYATPGVYSVSLVVSNSLGNSTKAVSNYVHTFWNSTLSGNFVSEGFEGGLIPNGWMVINKQSGTPTWEISNYGAGTSSKSIMLGNANTSGDFRDNIDILESPSYDFHNLINPAFSFDYAYARKPTTLQDTFKVQYSLDCGGTWSSLIPIAFTAATMAAASGGTLTAPFVPFPGFSPTQWVNRSFPTLALSQLSGKPNVKFRFYFRNDLTNGTSQNLYLDNINISGTVGLEELESSITLSVYPNPTNSASVVEFTPPFESNVQISVYDVTGRMVEQSGMKASAGVQSKYTVNASGSLQSGIYFITLSLDSQKITKKLIVQ